MRATSIQAWYNYRLSEQRITDQFRVVGWFLEHGRGTQYEVENQLSAGRRSLGKRFSELERAGALTVCDTKINPDSGQICHVYTLTGRPPRKRRRRKPKPRKPPEQRGLFS